MTDFFSQMAKSYDEKNSNLSPISENMHFLIRLMLKDLPTSARILCVGVGTGAEILSLSKENPKWSFVGVDPSQGMLDVCRERLTQAGVMHRCDLRHGYVQEVPIGEHFDAVLSILVGHFVSRDERLSFYQHMAQRLKAGGYLINTEISFDLDSAEFPAMLKNWECIQALMGATPEALADLPHTLRNRLTVLAPPEIEGLLRDSGISIPVRFFQAFMIHGWCGQK